MKLSLFVLFVCLIFAAINAQTAVKAEAPVTTFILEDAPAFKQLQATVNKSNSDVQASVKALTGKVSELTALVQQLQKLNAELSGSLKASKEDSSKLAAIVSAQLAEIKASANSSPIFAQVNKYVALGAKKATEAATATKTALGPFITKAQPFVNKACAESTKAINTIVAIVNAKLPVAREAITKLAAQAGVPAESVPFFVTSVLAFGALLITSFSLFFVQVILSIFCCCGKKKSANKSL